MVSILYVLALGVLLAACTGLVLLVHELGHATAALALAPGPVTVYVGSYGQPEGNWHLRLGRLQLHIRRHLLRWRGGGCQHEPLDGAWQNVVIVLAGPLLPLLLGIGGFCLSLQYPNGLWRLLLFVFVLVAFTSCLGNLLRADYVRFADGQRVGNDGLQLRAYLRQPGLHRLAEQAHAQAEAGENTASARTHEQLLRKLGPTTELFQNLVNCYWLAGQLDDALAASQRFEQALPARFGDDDLFMRGNLLSGLGKHQQAVALYGELTGRPVPYPGAYNNRGYAHLLLEEYALAIPDFDQAIALDASRAFAYNNRGLARLQLGQPAEALADIKEGLRLDPSNAYAHRNLGIWQYEQQQYPQALACLEQAHALGPDTPELPRYLQAVRERLAG